MKKTAILFTPIFITIQSYSQKPRAIDLDVLFDGKPKTI